MIKVGQEINTKRNVVWLLVWNLPVQEEADWLRLFLLDNKVENIAKRTTGMHSTNLVHFYPTPANLVMHTPILIV